MAITAADRCDRCGAQAYTRYADLTAPDIAELLFCNHHAHRYTENLETQGFTLVEDDRYTLYPTAPEPEWDPA